MIYTWNVFYLALNRSEQKQNLFKMFSVQEISFKEDINDAMLNEQLYRTELLVVFILKEHECNT